LRRMKTDRSIIADLPTRPRSGALPFEPQTGGALCAAVDSLEDDLDSAGRHRPQGTGAGSLMRLKQICNHPSQWLGDQAWGKRTAANGALRDIAEVIAARQEKMLVFTQFREVIDPLALFSPAFSGGPADAAWRDGGQTTQDARPRFPGRREDPVFCSVSEGRWVGPHPDGGVACRAFRRWWNRRSNQATDGLPHRSKAKRPRP